MRKRKSLSPGSVCGITLLFFLTNQILAADQQLSPLPLKLPTATLRGTPEDLPKGPMIEIYTEKKRPDFLAPAGVKNVAFGKGITASTQPFSGTLPQITDGKREPYDEDVVEFRKGTQWVQLDLEKEYPIYALVLWHDHRYIQVFQDVAVQAADDPDFTKNVRTIFNNDTDNSSGLGIGTDKEYFEKNEGKLIDMKGAKARYLRFYSRGLHEKAGLNAYQEIEVYALP